MKEISLNTKFKVIKLFFAGLSYDEIAMQVGIAKGSVVNIIDQFREGKLPVPPGMTGYIDELRKVVVDMKKHSATVIHLKGYIKLYAKITEMGVETDHVGQWLDICQEIATPTVSNNEFVSAALQLAELNVNTGQDYNSIISQYKANYQSLKDLQNKVQQEKKSLAKLQKYAKQEKARADKDLEAIKQGMANAQGDFLKQKDELQKEIDNYLAQNQLTWDKVNTAHAILRSVLSEADIRDLRPENVPPHHILIGGFPCQSFSIVAQNPPRLGYDDDLHFITKISTANNLKIKSCT